MSNLTPEYINENFPIVAVEVYENGVMEIIRESKLQTIEKKKKGNRKKVTELSKKSLTRLAFLASVNSQRFKTMLTLTYGIEYPMSGIKAKKDLNRFLVSFRRLVHQEYYLWFLEFQKRSAPHFHILSSAPTPTPEKRRRAAEIWLRSSKVPNVSYTSLKTGNRLNQQIAMMEFNCSTDGFWEPIRSKEGAKRYITKYALKTAQKSVPPAYSDVGRFWGCSRSCSNPVGLKIEVSEDDMRNYINTNVERLKGWDVIPKYIF